MLTQSLRSIFISMTLLFSSSLALATPAQILIIRHGEKPAVGNQLSPRGWQRARALVQYFETNKAVTQYGTPIAIYAMKQDGVDGSVRPIQTVTPLAQDLGKDVKTPYLRDDYAQLVKDILADRSLDGKMVLICWEHKVIPGMAYAFGVRPQPADWSGSDFDTVFEINFSGNQVSSFKTFPEGLN